MLQLHAFIKYCERELVLNRNLSEEVLASVDKLSDRNKILTKPVLEFITRDPIEFEVELQEIVFLSEERILVGRLIPLYFGLNTSSPAWSSYTLTQAIKAATTISGISLAEIGMAFLEIFSDFSTPLNKVVYHFCMDFSIEFTVHYRQILHEFESLLSWKSTRCSLTPSVAFLKYVLVPINCYRPKFIVETMIVLVPNEFFEVFVEETKYLFEDLVYKQDFVEFLSNYQISRNTEDIILSVVKSVT